jgi:superfamily II DNA/RNA helicase
VILIHSREVITQTLNLFDQLTKNLSIKLKTMAPGMPPAPGPVHILLLTPGFLNKLNAAELEKVTCFVVDEADQQISEENRRNRLKYVIDNVIPPSAQKLFVSATYSDAAKFLIQGILDDVQEVFEDNPTITSTVEMFYVEC